MSVAAQDVVVRRKGMGKYSVIFACGTALFSDGYQNGIAGSVNTILRILYPTEYGQNNYAVLFTSMVFAGTVIGMLAFGWISDKIGRKVGMIAATGIVFVFVALSTGAYSGGSIQGMFRALIAYRFLMGIGIGAEYPAGSVGASENTEDPSIKKGTQHLLFVLATNCVIDWGFVISAFTPLLCIWMFGENHLRAVWRVALGIGMVPPLAVLIWRTRMSEPLRFQQESMKNAPTPYWLVFKRYWKSFLGLSVAWFIYDFIAYPFGIYSSSILQVIYGSSAPLTTVFGWNVVINLFYIPGCMGGAFIVDRVGPKRLMIIMLCLQAAIGFIMSGLYTRLIEQIAAFAVVYGIFIALGEAGPGNCLGLLAAKSWPTGVRGQMYGIAAAIGKLGAFAGTYAFPSIIARFPAGPAQSSGPFWVGSGLAIFSALCVFFLVPEIPADHMTLEDAAFRIYLKENGYDTSRMGTQNGDPSSLEEMFAPSPKDDNEIAKQKSIESGSGSAGLEDEKKEELA